MGSGSFSLPILAALTEGGTQLPVPVEVVGVVTQPDRPAGRGRRLRANSVAVAAVESEISVLKPQRLRRPEALAELAALAPDIVVVAAYGQILPTAALQIPAHGCLNLHPSLLPRHRGPAPVAGTILSGDRTTATTLMLMNEAMDAGPLIGHIETGVAERETAGELEARLGTLSGTLLLQELPGWLRGDLAAVPQNEAEATYTHMLTKDEARVDWKVPAELIDRQVRAFDPWPVAHCEWKGQAVRLFRSHTAPGAAEPGQVLGLDGSALAIGTGRNILVVEELQLAGARRLAAADAVRGHPSILGATLE